MNDIMSVNMVLRESKESKESRLRLVRFAHDRNYKRCELVTTTLLKN
jgi:hypothetical protein